MFKAFLIPIKIIVNVDVEIYQDKLIPFGVRFLLTGDGELKVNYFPLYYSFFISITAIIIHDILTT